MQNPRRIFLIAIGFVIAATLSLDRLFFSGIIFYPENRSGWDSFRWYNFEYHFRKISERGDDRPLVLIVGSSIAQYSAQKNLLEAVIEERYGRRVRVELLVHAAMLPTDLYHYGERIRELNPALIVYITNPGDLDLERYSPPWEASPAYSDDAELSYLDMRYPVKIYYPASFASRHWRDLSPSRTISLLLREVMYSVRFRGEWIESLEFSLKAKGDQLRSYLYYQGVHIPEGIFVTGDTGTAFSFSPGDLRESKSLLLETPVALAEAGVSMTIYAQRGVGPHATLERGALSDGVGRSDLVQYVDGFEVELKSKRNGCGVRGSARRVAEIPLRHAGWSRVELPSIGADERYYIRLSKVLNSGGVAIPVGPNDPCYAGHGLRLPGNFGLRAPRSDDYLVRRPTLDDLRLHDMNPIQYTKDYEERIQSDDWRTGRRAFISMNLIRLGKLYTNWFDFQEIPQAAELRSFLSLVSPAQVLIINNPENPIAYDDYGGTRWYAGYIEYMNSLTGDRVHFKNLSTALSENHFIDPHHLTYYGMLRMAPLYARSIIEFLSK